MNKQRKKRYELIVHTFFYKFAYLVCFTTNGTR